jgi:hypothetical protein
MAGAERLELTTLGFGELEQYSKINLLAKIRCLTLGQKSMTYGNFV